jgi:hypothetical protein
MQCLRRRRRDRQLGQLAVQPAQTTAHPREFRKRDRHREEVAAALRELRLLDADCERLVFRIRARNDRAILPATDSDLAELIGFVAAEANHEPSRRRRERLDTAFDALSNAAHAAGC